MLAVLIVDQIFTWFLSLVESNTDWQLLTVMMGFEY